MTGSTRANVWRQAPQFAGITGAVISVLGVAEGSSAGTAFGAAIVGAVTVILLSRSRSLASSLLCLFISQNFTAAIVFRLLTFQGLDGDLHSPAISYLLAAIIALVCLSLSLADTRRRTFRIEFRAMDTACLLAFGWGLLALTLDLILNGALVMRSPGGGLAGGLGIFSKHIPFFCLPVVLYASDARLRRKRLVSLLAAFVVLTSAVLALLLNERKLAFDVALAGALGYWSGGNPIRPRALIASMLLGVLFFGFFSPLISYMRFDIRAVAPADRMEYIVSKMPLYVSYVLEGRPLPDDVQGALAAHYLNYAGVGAVRQRLAGAQILDLAVNSTYRSGGTESDPVVFGIRASLPSNFFGDKHTYSLGDDLTWGAGLREYGSEGHPFVNLPASSVWGYGVVLGMLLTSTILSLFVALIRIVRPALFGSTWGILMFLALYNACGEGDVARWLEVLFRFIPEVGIMCWLIEVISARRGRLQVQHFPVRRPRVDESATEFGKP